MTVRIRLFAVYREAALTGELTWPPDDAAFDTLPPTVGALWEALKLRHPRLATVPPAIAVNAVLVRPDHPLCPGDEVAFLPPVSGG